MEKCKDRLKEVLQGNEDNYLYPFFWLHGADKKTLEDYVHCIYQSGCRAFCVESRPHPDFLGDSWWRDMEIILNKAESLEMKVWILDDAHFPTGYANGRIKTAHDDLKQWYLYHRELDLTGPVRNGKISVIDEKNKNGGLVNAEEEIVSLILVKRINGENFVSAGEVEDMTEKIQNGWLTLNLPDGKYRLYIIVKSMRKQKVFSDYMDMTNPESVKLLLDETYEKHYQHYKEKFGKVIEGFFSDEPGFYNSDNDRGYSFQYQIGADMYLPWNSYIALEFCEKLYDQGILSEKDEKLMRQLLPSLWFPCGKDTGEIRAAYMDTLTDLYRKNFTGQVSDWCHRHGVLYVGHVIEDNNCHARLGCGPGHYFRALTGQDMSGIDVVLQQIMPQKDYLQYGFCSDGNQDGAFNFYGLGKLGASMSHIDARTDGRAMCEIFGAYGWIEGISMMKWLADHMLVRGLNIFVPHAFSEKEFPDGDCPPHFYAHGKNPQYPHMHMLFHYMNRAAHLLSGGRSVTDIGVWYHAEAEWRGRSMYFHTVGEKLMKNQMDYEVIPLEALEQAVYQEGKLMIGSLNLRCLLIPAADRYPNSLRKCILKCIRSNIPVYQVNGKLPDNSREGENGSISADSYGERLKGCVQIELDDLAEEMKKRGFCQITLQLNDKRNYSEWLRYYHYHSENGRHIYFLFHEGQSGVIEGKLTLPCMEHLIRYDALGNELYQVDRTDDGLLFVRLYPGEALIFISNVLDVSLKGVREKNVAVPGYPGRHGQGKWKQYTGGMLLTGTDNLQRRIFSVWKEKDEWESFDLEEEYPGFGGVLCYEFEIHTEEEQLVALELEYAKEAVTVWVNGKCAGTAISGPYSYDVSEISETGINHIRIEIFTTMAYAIRDSFSRHAVFLPEGLQGQIRYQII